VEDVTTRAMDVLWAHIWIIRYHFDGSIQLGKIAVCG
jgi:hypothetical protein